MPLTWDSHLNFDDLQKPTNRETCMKFIFKTNLFNCFMMHVKEEFIDNAETNFLSCYQLQHTGKKEEEFSTGPLSVLMMGVKNNTQA